MATVANINSAVLNDRALKLVREQYIRRMSWGDNWQQLRIILRYAYEAPSNAQQSTSLFIGVTSNMGQWNDANCTILGYWLANAPGAFPGLTTANYNAGPPSYYSGSSNGFRAVLKTGFSLSFAGGPSEGTFWPIAPLSQLCGVVLDRETASSLYAAAGYNNNSWNPYNLDRTGFLQVLDSYYMSSAFLGGGGRGGGSIASGTTAPLDCVIVINFSSVPICIYDIGAQRIF